MFEKFEWFYTTMRPMILKSGFNEKLYDDFSFYAKAVESDILNDIIAEMDLIHECEHAATMKIWKQLPEQVWTSYDLFEITGLQEQVILKDCLKALRKACATLIKKYVERMNKYEPVKD